MGLFKGNPTLNRYRLLDSPEDLTDEFIRDRLTRNSFVDIENTAEESSLGWVEIMSPLATGFDPAAWRFGGFLAFQARLDTRRLSAKTLNRYYLIKEAEIIAQTGRKPNSHKKKEMMESLRQDLMRRSLLNTDLLEVLWFLGEREIWIGGAGEKKRLIFEDLWERTFGLPVRLLVPITLGLEMLPKKSAETLFNARARFLMGDEDD
ncbi:MAG: recombination-associated protein RdgC [Deltaproteobacteria bacterium]|jgi:DNA recombination-dependent growth factor C|nr:recombination-associated protein RdgC [Deltaproteobacteria bacterium]